MFFFFSCHGRPRDPWRALLGGRRDTHGIPGFLFPHLFLCSVQFPALTRYVGRVVVMAYGHGIRPSARSYFCPGRLPLTILFPSVFLLAVRLDLVDVPNSGCTTSNVLTDPSPGVPPVDALDWSSFSFGFFRILSHDVSRCAPRAGSERRLIAAVFCAPFSRPSRRVPPAATRLLVAVGECE